MDSEILAAPLVATSAFCNSTGKVFANLDPSLGGPTSEVWRETERVISSSFPGLSLDEFVIRRDAIWFGKPGVGYRPMLTYLREATAHLLCSTKGANGLSPQFDRYEKDLRREWRWVRFALPADLLLAAMRKTHLPELVVSHTIRKTLEDRGFAESHLHMKAAIDFPMLWQSLQAELYGDRANRHMIQSPGADFTEGTEFAPWLLRNAISRVALAEFLKSGFNSFQDFLNDSLCPRLKGQSSALVIAGLKRVLVEVRRGKLPGEPKSRNQVNSFWDNDFASVREIYRVMTSAHFTGSPGVDPISTWFPSTADQGCELPFLTSAFDYLESVQGESDIDFAALFWQSQRLRCRFYRHIVQRPLYPGLQFFTRTYDRLSAPRKSIKTKEFIYSAKRLSGPGLQSLEVRIAPENTWSAMGKEVQDFSAAFTPTDPEAGLVLHFLKLRGKDTQKGNPRAFGKGGYINPRHTTAGYRYSQYYIERRPQAVALATLVLTFPNVLERVRGIDFCTDELGIPFWVLKPLVEYVHKAGLAASRKLQLIGDPLPALRTTIHAGEDFVHLIGGIRRVAEPIEYFRMGDGDRIGHGISLGTNVESWVARVPSLAISTGERLFDLLWARRYSLRNGDPKLLAFLPGVEYEILLLAENIFGGCNLSLAQLEGLDKDLHTSSKLQAVGFPSGVPFLRSPSPSQRLLIDWLCNSQVFKKSEAVVCIAPAREVEFVALLQRAVRTEVASKGIVIEINPTSNLLVGNLGDLTEHPLWLMNSPKPDEQHEALRLCIGSDDPISVATSLPEEYQLIADAIVELGLTAQHADAWLEQARKAGMASRFTVQSSGRNLFAPILGSVLMPPLVP